MRLHDPTSLPAPTLVCAALAALLTACGGEQMGGVDSESNTGTSATGTGTVTETSPSTPTSEPTGPTTDEPTAGSMSQSGTGTDTDPNPTDSATDTATATATSTSTTSTTEPATGTTDPAQTDTSNTSTVSETMPGETTIMDTTIGDTTIGDTTVGDTTDGDTDETTEGVEPCACPDIEVPLDDGIFVLGDNSELWKFFPETNEFQELGAFQCGNMPSTFSMAVDRLGFAWIMFSNPNGEIWKLDVTNVNNCIDPGYNQGQQGVNYFGMAFVSNGQTDQCDQLYGNTFDGFGGFDEGAGIGDFLRVTPDTLQIQKLGKTNFNGAELTGTGDGRAFMFGGVNPAKLVEVDKTNGTFIDVLPLPGLELTNAFAFAFFAGDFYFFTESNNLLLSKVTHIDYDDSDNDGQQQLTTVVAQAPIRIVGAGVSTCAPFIPM